MKWNHGNREHIRCGVSKETIKVKWFFFSKKGWNRARNSKISKFGESKKIKKSAYCVRVFNPDYVLNLMSCAKTISKIKRRWK